MDRKKLYKLILLIVIMVIVCILLGPRIIEQPIGGVDFPGQFVFVSNGRLTSYSKGHEDVLFPNKNAIFTANKLLVNSHYPKEIVFISRNQQSGSILIGNNGQVNVSINRYFLGKLRDLKDYTYYDGRLYKVVGKGRKVALLSISKTGKETTHILGSLPTNIFPPNDDWSSLPSISSKRKVVFSIPVEKGHWPIVITDIVGKKIVKVAEGRNPSLSPDGSSLAYIRGYSSKINILNFRTGYTSTLTLQQSSFMQRTARIGRPLYVDQVIWLGDCSHIAASVVRQYAWQHELQIANISTGHFRKLPIKVDPIKWVWIPKKTIQD
jgi:hypothetical protein